MSGRAMGGHHKRNRGDSDRWLTPPDIIDALGPFDLDPCADLEQPWRTATEERYWSGLIDPWHGFVWCNPPYSEVWTWLAKLADHGDGIALIFARTETAGFVREVWGKADGLLFLHGRLHFHHPGGERAKANSGAPSVLVAYGQRAVDRLTGSGLNGTVLYDWAQPIAWEDDAA